MSYFKVIRGWQDSAVWEDEPYSQREAWLWMVGEANFKDKKIAVNGQPFTLRRGQFRSSIRFMADKFQWSTNRVLRFLERLRSWSMVETATETGQIIISICNYRKYQDHGDTNGDANGNSSGDSDGDTNGDKLEEGKEGKEYIIIPGGVSEPVWKDFLKHRKAKKAPVTQTVIKQITREAEKAGWTLEAALSEVCARNWQGFKAEWIKNERATNENTSRKPTKTERLHAAGQQALDELCGPAGPPQNLAIAGPTDAKL